MIFDDLSPWITLAGIFPDRDRKCRVELQRDVLLAQVEPGNKFCKVQLMLSSR